VKDKNGQALAYNCDDGARPIFVVGALDFFSWPGEMTVFADCANAVGHYELLSQSSKQLDKRKLFG
jgi:hypothetical protein